MSKTPQEGKKPAAGWAGKAGKAPKGDAWHARKHTQPKEGLISGEPRRPGKGPPGTSRGDR